VTLVGAALMFDARLLGRSRPLAVSALERHCCLGALSLLSSFPPRPDVHRPRDRDAATPPCAQADPARRGVPERGIFHRWPFRTVGDWDTEIRAPVAARVNGVLSIALW